MQVGRGGFVADLRIVLRGRDFRALFAVRLVSQFGDGALNVALAAYVFFSPERAADGTSAAAAFAALLLPFSLIGPFAGVLLDRWRRRQVLLGATVVRAVAVLGLMGLVLSGVSGAPFYLLALAAIGLNRFFLAGLGASLPHVVDDDELVMANAVSPTCGTLSALAGGATGFAVRDLIGGAAAGDAAAAVVFGLAATCYAMAAALSLRLHVDLLGPDFDPARPVVREAVRHILAGMTAAVTHVRERRPAAYGLAMIAVHRFAYGLSTVATILLYRNYFNDPDDVDGGLAGLGLAFIAAGIGFGIAAVLTPIATRRMTAERWIVLLLAFAAFVEVMPGIFYTEPTLLVASLGLGVSAQGIKICVDSLVQHNVDDAFRGRVFAFYDVIFNVVFVAAAVVAAATLPPDGKSYPVLLAISLIYAGAAVTYDRWTRSVAYPVPGLAT